MGQWRATNVGTFSGQTATGRDVSSCERPTHHRILFSVFIPKVGAFSLQAAESGHSSAPTKATLFLVVRCLKQPFSKAPKPLAEGRNVAAVTHPQSSQAARVPSARPFTEPAWVWAQPAHQRFLPPSAGKP